VSQEKNIAVKDGGADARHGAFQIVTDAFKDNLVNLGSRTVCGSAKSPLWFFKRI
jgi:hypothetical protein